jgi:hypothetical protein
LKVGRPFGQRLSIASIGEALSEGLTISATGTFCFRVDYAYWRDKGFAPRRNPAGTLLL